MIINAAQVFKEDDSAQDEPQDKLHEEVYLDEEVYDVNDFNQGVINKVNNVYSCLQSPQSGTHCVIPVVSGSIPKINRINVYESPILTCTHGTQTMYIVLDSGATCSLLSLKTAQKLNLQISKTNHKAVQVDGQSSLPVVGEVHTVFTRGTIPLYFSGLVITNMATDILGGTNFLIENDISYRMSKGTISIGTSCTVLAASPTLLALDKLDTRLRLVKVTEHTELVPGEYTTLPLPPDLPRKADLVVGPNCSQTPPFFTSSIIQAEDGNITI